MIIHYIININLQNGTKEYDMSYDYMMIEGERYDFPYGIGMEDFSYEWIWILSTNKISKFLIIIKFCFFIINIII